MKRAPRNLVREAFFRNRFLRLEAKDNEAAMRKYDDVKYTVELPNRWLTHSYRIPASSVAPLMSLDIPDETP